jgi:hypothetical protein
MSSGLRISLKLLFVAIILVAIGGLYFFYVIKPPELPPLPAPTVTPAAKATPALTPAKEEKPTPCQEYFFDLDHESDCVKMEKTFRDHRDECIDATIHELDENHDETVVYKDAYFAMAECYLENSKTKEAERILREGLTVDDWKRENEMESYNAHFLLQRKLEEILPPENKKCQTIETFEAAVKKFVKTHDPEALHELVYSENSLKIEVMASDSGGSASFSEWKENILGRSGLEKIKYSHKVGKACFVVDGWESEFPWQAYCATQKSGKPCYYLESIYEGIAETLSDLEAQEKNEH